MPLSENDLDLIRDAHAQTGIICVKNKITGKLFSPSDPMWTNIPDDDVEYFSREDPRGEILRKRGVIREFVGSQRWPKGLPIGCCHRFQREVMGGDKRADIGPVYDIAHHELKRLQALSKGLRTMTDEERKEDGKIKAAQRERRADFERDPAAANAAAVMAGIVAVGEKAMKRTGKKGASPVEGAGEE